MAAFPLPACDAAALQRRLCDEYRVEAPVIEWNGWQLVRVSVQGYNTEEDAQALMAALTAALPRPCAALRGAKYGVSRKWLQPKQLY
jgi:isopenicillin-N epimerase